MNDAERTYQLLEADAYNWLEQARGARLSADVIYAALMEVMPLSQALPTIREKKLAYMQSFMLLTAVAFENLLKGIAVAADPTSWRQLQDDSGHGIAAFAAAVAPLSDDERDLLLRLQEHLVWAGRYTIPKKPSRYASNQGRLVLLGTDPALVSALFERLSGILQSRIKKQRA